MGRTRLTVGRSGIVGVSVVAAAVVTVSGAATAGGSSRATADPRPAVSVTEAADTMSARALARAKGSRVEALDQRGETREVYANPDGTFTAHLRMTPVRVRSGSGWVPVDTTLRPNPDGGVGPVATTRLVVFSGGGRQPLVRLSDAGRQIALSWPGPLPAPVLSKDTARYGEVLPGVDLRMRATADGFAMVLVVKDRAAAANPALTALRFGLTTEGLTALTDGSGSVGFVDGRGESVFVTGAPMSWDSGAKRAIGQLLLQPGFLTLVPDGKLLTDPTVTFPLFIDPPFSPFRSGFALVFSGYAGNSYWGGDGESLGKVGQCYRERPDKCNGIREARSFFRFDTSFLTGRHVLYAEFNAFLAWSPSCAPRPVEAWGTNSVDAGTTWTNQPFPAGGPTFLGSHDVAAGYSGSCPGRSLGWGGAESQNAPMVTVIKNSLAFNRGVATILLTAPYDPSDGENDDQLAWKKFAVNGQTPSVSVVYNSYPNAPANLKVENQPCAQAPNEPYVNPYLNNDPTKGPRGPRLSATISDADGGLVHGQFELYDRGGPRRWVSPPGSVAAGAPGATFAIDVPSQFATDGARLSYRIRGADGTDFGPWSPAVSPADDTKCDVTIDRTAPDRAPTVASMDYPECVLESCPAGGGLGRTGVFTIDRNGVGDAVGFRYDLHDQPSTFAAADGSGRAAIMLTPPRDGPLDLFVRSIDRAGNVGPLSRYHFFVGPGTPATGHWRLQGIDETTVPDEAAGHHHGAVVLGPAAAWIPGRDGDALWLNGTTGVTTTNGPTVHTNQSFAVSAWVRLDIADSADHPAVSQDGQNVPGFFLGYVGDQRRFTFRMSAQDSMSAPAVRAVAPRAAVAGAWTHLIGVYDRGLGQLQLHVNGALAGTVPLVTAWDATGTVQIGRARTGTRTDHWPGAIDEVRAYDRILSTQEVHDLATAPATEELFWPLDDGGPSTAPADASGNYRTGALDGGASWTVGIVGSGALRLDGVSGAVHTGGPVIRTDNSFTVTARVVLERANGAHQTVLSQDGSQHSGFVLRYRGDTRKWTFLLSQVENDAGRIVAVDSVEPARSGEWTHLAGVYDTASKRIRIYVNGALAGEAAAESTWNATGQFRIGRGMSTSTQFGGLVDDVHVWTGVRSGDQIRDEFLSPVTGRATAYTGQLSRYYNTAGFHVVTTEMVPPGAHFEGSMGLMAPAEAENTWTIYSCRLGATDYYLSRDPDCEGYARLGSIGQLYRDAPTGVPTIAVYRCLIPGQSHFTSHDPLCERHTTEFLLGYARSYAKLVRSYSIVDGDHTSSIFRVPASYGDRQSLGFVANQHLPGTTALWHCRDGADTFASIRSDCEGTTVVRWIGNIWISPPENVTGAAELFRCRAAAGERWESLDQYCLDGAVDRSLGFVVIEP